MLDKALRNGVKTRTPYVCLQCRINVRHGLSVGSSSPGLVDHRPYASVATRAAKITRVPSSQPESVSAVLDRLRDVAAGRTPRQRRGKRLSETQRRKKTGEPPPVRIVNYKSTTKPLLRVKYTAGYDPNDPTSFQPFPPTPRESATETYLQVIQRQDSSPKVSRVYVGPRVRYAATRVETELAGKSDQSQALPSKKLTPLQLAQRKYTAESESPRGGRRRRRASAGVATTPKPRAKGVPAEEASITAKTLALSVIDAEQPGVPRLAYGLDRVLFNPGVYHLRDKRSGVYNFDPFLEKITPLQKFDFSTLNRFTPSSEDTVLSGIASSSKKRYVGSTSSMTGVLKHFHFQLSNWRALNLSMLSRGFPSKTTAFTKLTRSPDAIFLRYKNGTYAVDSDKLFDGANVLSLMGRYMEKLLTLDKRTFKRYEKNSSDPITDDERSQTESFHYSTAGDFVLRSQLDAYDARLPGTGMFDLKTRAVVPIRMDSKNYEWGMGYEINADQGEYFSFEREYFDMLRSTLLKYSLQARIGRMDGIFVAYHNIIRMFGFQYISINEMDEALHGQNDRQLGDQEFLASLTLLNKVLDRATERFPKTSIRLHFECREGVAPFTYIFAEPVSEEQANAIQTKNKGKIEEWERTILEAEPAVVRPAVEDTPPAAKSEPAENAFSDDGTLSGRSNINEKTIFIPFGWTKDCSSVQFERSEDATIPVVRHENIVYAVLGPLGVIGGAHQPDDLIVSPDKLRALNNLPDVPHLIRQISSTPKSKVKYTGDSKSPADARFLASLEDKKEKPTHDESTDPDAPVLALILTTNSNINGVKVSRPANLGADDDWTIDYSISEIDDPSRARKLYEACLKRRRMTFENDDEEEGKREDYFITRLRSMTEVSRKWREGLDELEKERKENGGEARVRMWNDEEYPGKEQKAMGM